MILDTRNEVIEDAVSVTENPCSIRVRPNGGPNGGLNRAHGLLITIYKTVQRGIAAMRCPCDHVET